VRLQRQPPCRQALPQQIRRAPDKRREGPRASTQSLVHPLKMLPTRGKGSTQVPKPRRGLWWSHKGYIGKHEAPPPSPSRSTAHARHDGVRGGGAVGSVERQGAHRAMGLPWCAGESNDWLSSSLISAPARPSAAALSDVRIGILPK